MKEFICIEIGKIFAGPEFNSDFLSVWKEVQSYFKNGINFKLKEDKTQFHISICASDIIEGLENLKSVENTKERSRLRKIQGKSSITGDLKITIESEKLYLEDEGQNIKIYDIYIYRFLQQLFVAMNIACPVSLSTGYSKSKNGLNLPDLFTDLFEDAVLHSRENSWPPINKLPFKDCWEWVHRMDFFNLNLGRMATEKATLTLLRLGESHDLYEDNVLIMCRALKALVSPQKYKIKETLKEFLPTILGEPKTCAQWLDQLYELRNKQIHGETAIMRPGAFEGSYDPPEAEEIFNYHQSLVTSVGVLLALLQHMVIQDTQLK